MGGLLRGTGMVDGREYAELTSFAVGSQRWAFRWGMLMSCAWMLVLLQGRCLLPTWTLLLSSLGDEFQPLRRNCLAETHKCDGGPPGSSENS